MRRLAPARGFQYLYEGMALSDPVLDAPGRRRLAAGTHATPHDVLGAHPAAVGGRSGIVVRAWHPDAVGVDVCWPDGEVTPLAGAHGLFAAFVPGRSAPARYRLRFRFPNGDTWERDDPYRFLPTLGDVDLHLLNEGTHRRLGERLGARPLTVDGVEGTAFAVWAPSARRVSVVGEFCRWDGRLLPMRALGSSGVFELFVPGVGSGDLYKYEILTPDGHLRVKTDPVAAWYERPPGSAARVFRSEYRWGDDAWMAARPHRDWRREPFYAYEVHLGSWARVPEEGNRQLSYREIAPRLVEHVRRLGFTHVELLPVMEHPFEGSWGYQVSGYYAPTSRFGTPDDFRFLVDACHQAGIGVILDWVPAHFPRDDWALRRFDGTALYEHADPREGEHPDWGTLIFNYGRREVVAFLVSNAVHWCTAFHADGLRVDAVASMLYRDYSRREGQWVPNRYGGRENLEAIAFLRAMNDAVAAEAPGAVTVAEESTSWPGVTRATSDHGGLGFTFKWNMGWMHDTLQYFARDPVHRRFHQDELTFAMLYEWTERFVNPLSHDEVVHGKRSLFEKMPGDPWQRMANLRTLLAYQLLRPGKALLFMGTELAPYEEWNHDVSLPWHLAEDPARRGLQRFIERLARLYRERSPFWRTDPDPDGFRWIDCSDRQHSIVSWVRRDGEAHAVVVLNLTPTPRDGYRIGAPASGTYVEVLSSDAAEFGGSGHGTPARVVTEPVAWQGHPQSMRVRLPPLAALVLAPDV